MLSGPEVGIEYGDRRPSGTKISACELAVQATRIELPPKLQSRQLKLQDIYITFAATDELARHIALVSGVGHMLYCLLYLLLRINHWNS